MSCWLFKTEPGCFSIDDLEFSPGRTTPWDGVRNFQARNLMRSMKKGERGFLYHSGKSPAIVGVVSVGREAYPDHTALDRSGRHFDPKWR
ncbi:MAG: EVE domain-containing protein, partial [Mailhella sp.]|nr:EVE domain-containing protein [Mailhella sp.]